jgi:hypothetical protein
MADLAAGLGVSPSVLQPHIDQVYHLDDGARTQVLALVQRIADIVSHIAVEHRTMRMALSH